MHPTEYAALRQRIAASSERVLSLQHLGEHQTGMPTDRESVLGRMRRNVLHGMVQDAVRQAPGADSTGLVLVDPRGGKHYIAPVRLGAGPTSTDDARRAVEEFTAAGELLPRLNGVLHPPIDDPLVCAAWRMQTDPVRPGTIISIAFADGSALVMMAEHRNPTPTPRTLFASAPVTDVEADHTVDPFVAPAMPALFELLGAAVPGPPPSPIGAALRQGWDQVVETQDGSFLVTAWRHAAVHVAVDPSPDGDVVVVRGVVLLDVPETPALHRFIAECSTTAALATVGILGDGPVDVVIQHAVPLRDLDGENLRLMVKRIGRLADVNVLPLQADLGGRTLR